MCTYIFCIKIIIFEIFAKKKCNAYVWCIYVIIIIIISTLQPTKKGPNTRHII